ncbi:MAG: hypothetical protein LBQ60_21275 [Bacteroidales bacterium]|jgi:hypothetical protein|nr:hypothetical protein [Bacteroidales bacterium]
MKKKKGTGEEFEDFLKVAISHKIESQKRYKARYYYRIEFRQKYTRSEARDILLSVEKRKRENNKTDNLHSNEEIEHELDHIYNSSLAELEDEVSRDIFLFGWTKPPRAINSLHS